MSTGSLKCNDKAYHEHYEDIFPTITYRHLYSKNLGVRDPLRVIALCDSNAFYAACEMVRLGIESDKPLAVLQWESLIAVNYPARKYGISRMCKLKEALQKCPHLKVVHVATYKEGEKEPGYWESPDMKTHKVSLDYYRRESLKIVSMFKSELPGCEVEKASIDEAFIDFTQRIRDILFERYPYLWDYAPDKLDTSLPPPPPIEWKGLGFLIAVNPQSKPNASEMLNANSPEDTKPVEDLPHTWHDVALSIAAELMDHTRRSIHEKLGYTTSAGIARNKFLAKLTASHKKPDNQSILRNVAIPNYLIPLPFQKIRNLGGKLGVAVAKEFGASIVRDLLPITPEEMQRKLGEDSIWIWEILRQAYDFYFDVKEKSLQNKNMLASKSLPKPLQNGHEGHHWIRVLSADLALRLKDAREENPRLWPKTLVLHARRGYGTSCSKQAPFPFVRDFDTETIASCGSKLWDELVGNAQSLNVSSVQLSFSGIEVAEIGQANIRDFLKAHRRDREGDSSENLSFMCSRCNQTIRYSRSFSSEEVESTLATMKIEHDDFHLAQDLTKELTGPLTRITSQVSPQRPNKKRKSGPEPKGIEKFFARK